MTKVKKIYNADNELAMAEIELQSLHQDRSHTQDKFEVLKENLETLDLESDTVSKEVKAAKKDFKRSLQELKIAQEKFEKGLKDLKKVKKNAKMVKRELVNFLESIERTDHEIARIRDRISEIKRKSDHQ